MALLTFSSPLVVLLAGCTRRATRMASAPRRSARLLHRHAQEPDPGENGLKIKQEESQNGAELAQEGRRKRGRRAQNGTRAERKAEQTLKAEAKIEPKIEPYVDKVDTELAVEAKPKPKAKKQRTKAENSLVDLEDVWAQRAWAPTPELFEKVRQTLVKIHGPRPRGPRKGSVVDSLVQTILSQNTTDVNSHKCFLALKKRFETWDEVLETPDDEVAETIKHGGLSKVKTKRIKAIFEQIKAEQGSVSLEHLREKSTDEVKQELSQYIGVGPKTIACVLMFNLQRDEFPVDTHVCRLAQRFGWCPDGATREQVYEFLNNQMPGEMKYEMHLVIIAHGKAICQAGKPQCKICDLRPYCKHGSKKKRPALD
mmetsp:Transcript_4743/g.14308  ORF Transcript_4743/g.14308 Transcript_4743/m.14308 type:complete len:369 (-) Transcript_4743:1977-3083(-)